MWKYVESKLLLRVATLLRNKYASITKSDVISNTCQNCQDFYPIVLDICLAKKQTLTLVRTS